MDRSTARPCLECRNPLNRQGKGEFCSAKCKSAFHNRRTKRGALLLDVEMLMIRYPKQTAEWAERRDAMVMGWFREDAEARRARATRKLVDVRYDAEFPRAYEIADFTLQSE